MKKQSNNPLSVEQVEHLQNILQFKIWRTFESPSISDVELRDNGELRMTVSTMYNADESAMQELHLKLQSAADYLGYQHYDKIDDISHSGCDTCGIGGEHGYIVVFWGKE